MSADTNLMPIPGAVDPVPVARAVAARGTGTGSTGPGMGIRLVSALMANALSRCSHWILPAPRRAQRAAAASIAVGAPSSM